MSENVQASNELSFQLKSWAVHDEFASITLHDESVCWVAVNKEMSPQVCHGFYYKSGIDQIPIGLFLKGEKLHLIIGNSLWDWDAMRIQVKVATTKWVKGGRLVVILASHKVLYQENYIPENERPGAVRDVFYDQIDEEMDDWWLWVAHNFSSPKRRDDYIIGWDGGFLSK